MTPNLALTLSFDGIRVLHRSTAGWTPLAEVPLDAPDLPERLAQARTAALGLEPGGLRTKVMLPPEQVKVMEAGAPGAEAAREALRGATPYGLDELVIDHASVGGRNLVAAVARETLEEAEAFVTGYGFNPVGFAADLPGSGFEGEATFGETRLALASADQEAGPVAVGSEGLAAAIAEEPATAAPGTGGGFAEAPAQFGGQVALALSGPLRVARGEPVLVQAERMPLRAPARDEGGTRRPAARPDPAAARRSPGAAASRVAAWMRAVPRARGLILGAASVAAMLGVGVWASSVDGGDGLLQRDRAAEATQAQPEAASAVAQSGADPSSVGVPVSPSEAERVYASTGVWLRAPSLPDLPRADGVVPAVATALDAARPAGEAPDALLVAVADTGPVAPALPAPSGSRPLARTGGDPDAAGDVIVVAGPPAVVPPSRPGRVASAPVMAATEPPGRPAARPAAPELPATMQALVEALPASAGSLPQALTAQALALLAAPPGAPPSVLSFADPTAGAADLPRFAVARPPSRPDSLAPETPEAPVVLASFDGPRPDLRPAGLAPEAALPLAEVAPEAPEPVIDPAAVDAALAAAQQAAPVAPASPDVQTTLASIVAGAPDPLAGATRQAVALASRPDARPRNFGSVVSAQLGRAAQAQSAAVAAAAPRSNAPEDVEAGEPEVASSAAAAPSGATARSVAQAATFADAMALREVNLIGVFGQPGDRRALVRTGNGRYLRVGVGDSLDGGRVTAIGDNALNYSKRGRQMQLVIPGA